MKVEMKGGDYEDFFKSIFSPKVSTSNIIDIGNDSETKEALVELNKSTMNNGFNEIDLRTRLHPEELSLILGFEGLVMSNFLPEEFLHLVTYKKRLVISLLGKGREEIVEIVSKIDQKNTKLGETLNEWFKPNNDL